MYILFIYMYMFIFTYICIYLSIRLIQAHPIATNSLLSGNLLAGVYGLFSLSSTDKLLSIK